MDKETLQKAKSLEKAIESFKEISRKINNGDYSLKIFNRDYKIVDGGECCKKYIDDLLKDYGLVVRDEIENKIKSLEDEFEDL